MGIAVFPPASSGGIKSVQRGQAVSAGNITITAVDTTKTFVRSFSEGAAGTVATNSTVAAHNITLPAHGLQRGTNNTLSTTSIGNTTNPADYGTQWLGYTPAQTLTAAAAAASGGTMDATTKEMGVYLSNSTTLVATGACRWEVVEFN
jgi:hypothetical protein